MRASHVFRMASSSTIFDGVFGMNKPMGMSSAQVIRDCQHYFNPSAFFKPMIDQEIENRILESRTKRKRRGFSKHDIRVKMGHGGTLDPLATGVLILGVGKGTKALQSFLDCTKTYETVVLFGASTDTYDRVGKILKKTCYDHITRPMVEEALNAFRGKFQQVPPLYSALKMEGKPLYEYAREGKPIPQEIATREVEVSSLELVEWYEPGEHAHRWPAEEATTFERNFAEQVWKIEKQQQTSKKLTPEEEEEETKALKEHERFKRKSDENVDALVYDRVSSKRRRTSQYTPLMSGALGDLPPEPPKPGRGSNLVPASQDPNTPPPWDGKGPPAARIRMTVTSGFYVRSFCHDLGLKIGSAAMMAELCRSRQGDFALGAGNCLEYSDLAKGESVWAPQIKDMLLQWHNKSHTTSSQPPLRAKQNKPAHDQSKPAIRFADKSREHKIINKAEDALSSEEPPTPQPSSLVREEEPEEVTGSKPQGTQGSDGAVEALSTSAATTSTSQETAEPHVKSNEADEEPWAGFPDTGSVTNA
ncbi:trub family pseudouridylate synthase-containing protein [Durotheca rogersii]|uniref:trub family pseudouridylate synthase-containing protein n=1 Tax=Durotheca rogersii TaxID=419775 RepID=UPI002220C2E6|nr:trub family pseudouridylate synthase-containing protein [Durotheca rogersii]KAI5865515.1 trub family pseudouridylate synthase-containing protein [Durotheca rogersii]